VEQIGKDARDAPRRAQRNTIRQAARAPRKGPRKQSARAQPKVPAPSQAGLSSLPSGACARCDMPNAPGPHGISGGLPGGKSPRASRAASLARCTASAPGTIPLAATARLMAETIARKTVLSSRNLTSLLVGETLTSTPAGSVQIKRAARGKRRSGVQARKAWSIAAISVLLRTGRPLTHSHWWVRVARLTWGGLTIPVSRTPSW